METEESKEENNLSKSQVHQTIMPAPHSPRNSLVKTVLSFLSPLLLCFLGLKPQSMIHCENHSSPCTMTLVPIPFLTSKPQLPLPSSVLFWAR